MAEDAPVVHDEPVVYVLVRQILWKMITAMQPSAASYDHQLPDRFSPTQKYRRQYSGHIGDMDKGFADADVIIERTIIQRRHSSARLKHISALPVGRRSSGDPRLHPGTMALTPPVARLVGMKQHKVHVIKERVAAVLVPNRTSCWKKCAPGQPRDRASGTFPLHP